MRQWLLSPVVPEGTIYMVGYKLVEFDNIESIRPELLERE